jgi:hypothetical protein
MSEFDVGTLEKLSAAAVALEHARGLSTDDLVKDAIGNSLHYVRMAVTFLAAYEDE